MLGVGFVSLFPDLIRAYLGESILKRASDKGLASYAVANPRDFAEGPHRSVDDKPFGGGPGMLMSVGPTSKAIMSLKPDPDTAVVFAEPNGLAFRQRHARVLAGWKRLIFVSGHYEGIDDRLRERFATHVFSIGDFVLTGGELPSMVMADAVVRLLPGVLGDSESLQIDSHSDGLLGPPQFTRPVDFEGQQVPEVLLSGDHGAVAKWKRAQSLRLTRELRPDLFCSAPLDKEDLNLLSS